MAHASSIIDEDDLPSDCLVFEFVDGTFENVSETVDSCKSGDERNTGESQARPQQSGSAAHATGHSATKIGSCIGENPVEPAKAKRDVTEVPQTAPEIKHSTKGTARTRAADFGQRENESIQLAEKKVSRQFKGSTKCKWCELGECWTHEPESNVRTRSGRCIQAKDPEAAGIYCGQRNDENQPHGTGQLYYKKGDVFVGEFINGQMYQGVYYEKFDATCTMRLSVWIDTIDPIIVKKFPRSKGVSGIWEDGLGGTIIVVQNANDLMATFSEAADNTFHGHIHGDDITMPFAQGTVRGHTIVWMGGLSDWTRQLSREEKVEDENAALRQEERLKRRALWESSNKRDEEDRKRPTMHGWERTRDLGSSEQRQKFLRLMGGKELAKAAAEAETEREEGGLIDDADLPMDCPVFELVGESFVQEIDSSDEEGDASAPNGQGTKLMRQVLDGEKWKRDMEQQYEEALKRNDDGAVVRRGLGAI